MLEWLETLCSCIIGKVPNSLALNVEEQMKRNSLYILERDLEWTDDVLGKGAFGVVKRGVWLKTTEVAIKTLNNVPEFTDQIEINQFYNELQTLSMLRHPNIVAMYGYCKTESHLCLVSEFVKRGSLKRYIHDSNVALLPSLIVEIALSIVRGMVCLNSKGVLHRDLKVSE